MAVSENISKEDILQAISKMSIMEVVELVKSMEDTFGVSAASAVMAAPVAAGASPEAAAEEKTEFNVVMTAYGDKKIEVIKVIRAVTGLGLKEAKDMVEGVPSTVKEGIPKAEAEDIKNKLQEAGASVEIK
jgi:large subunit ribosomal protein L7/L12